MVGDTNCNAGKKNKITNREQKMTNHMHSKRGF
jgi:hypothetical protein